MIYHNDNYLRKSDKKVNDITIFITRSHQDYRNKRDCSEKQIDGVEIYMIYDVLKDKYYTNHETNTCANDASHS